MSKADEMFEELGYRNKELSYEIRYVRKFKLKRPRHIIFSKLDKQIAVCEENTIELAVNKDWFSMQELQAINQKCKELGWIDE